MKKLTALLLGLTTALALAGCGNDKENGSDIPDSEEFNQADVDFATAMIPHHAQALVMVDLTEGRDLSPDVDRLAEQILTAQTPEIETMAGWLTEWDQPIPETARDHENAHGDGDSDLPTDMPGMMSGEELAELEAAADEEFEPLWLEMMIEHHQGAIDMAKTERADGEYQPTLELAATIETTQQDEIDLMERLLGS
ncbi:DUF305 domain-containing protein [Nocardioides speluncae]|uniref:DUF305 domain-containing protein n=1 Tax=Nocardioides speluncae TaxID=2670337 RepID=UPI000D688E1A|nr:DUF305 domain-containing protein [Nocardioides speluncae]